MRCLSQGKYKYSIHEKFAGGAFGEVWRATGASATFVLKRMFVERGDYGMYCLVTKHEWVVEGGGYTK